MSGARLGILGGTFDPIHVGHVETALAARAALALDRVLLLPARVPPHRPQAPAASPFHRFAMTALAVNGIDGLEASDHELSVAGPSYTVDTLERLHHAGIAASQIFFIIGADAFAEIATWHRYPLVLALAHFVVIARPGYDAEAVTRLLPTLSARLATRSAADAAAPHDTRIFMVPASTPDVSSSEIRLQLRAGTMITGLVSESVEQHIRQHRLYAERSSATHRPLLQSAANHLHDQD